MSRTPGPKIEHREEVIALAKKLFVRYADGTRYDARDAINTAKMFVEQADHYRTFGSTEN